MSHRPAKLLSMDGKNPRYRLRARVAAADEVSLVLVGWILALLFFIVGFFICYILATAARPAGASSRAVTSAEITRSAGNLSSGVRK